MISYYRILNISRSASEEEIKKAYKALALKYHPDKNHGNSESEEVFKLVNEAYQVLSDPEQRRKHDLHLDYAKHTNQIYTASKEYKSEKSVYNRYGKYNWRNAPKYKQAPVYKIDKHYYRNVGISFLAMILFALLAMGISTYNEYLKEQEELRKEAEFANLVALTEKTYNQGEYKKALLQIESLVEKYPLEYRFHAKKDHLISELNNLAIADYDKRAYAKAVGNLEILKDFQKPVRISNWKLMADCYMRLKDFQNAARIYEFILERDSENLELMLQVAELYKQLGDKEKVRDYYNEARYTFKKFQEYSYGPAYEFVIIPEEVPEPYYNMFQNRAELMMEDQNYQEVIKDCNWGIFLRPDRAHLYALRAEARYNMNQPSRACNDFKRARERGYDMASIKIKLDCEI